MQNVADETNRYARAEIHAMRDQLKPRSIWKKWRDVSLTEMKCYIGVILKMAITNAADVKDYFSTTWDNYMPFFTDLFTRDRFCMIHWMLHVQPPSNPDPGQRQTRGEKVKNMVAHMKSKCAELYIPEQNIAVDETTISFKGRTSFLMYNSQKPTKWGLRVYSLADSKTGYLSQFEPYYGSCTKDILPYPDLPVPARVVLHLVKGLIQDDRSSGYHVYTDRYYTSPALGVELTKLRVSITGTVQKNRKLLPSDIKKKLKLKKNESVAWKSNKQLALVWQDKRLIFMYSTFHNAVSEEKERRKRGGEVEKIIKPCVISDYTEHMGAVDRFDHYAVSYNFSRKTVKWWRKTFYWLLEVAIVNSYILWCQCYPQDKLRHLAYHRKLINELVKDHRATKEVARRGRPSEEVATAERLNGRSHFIYPLDEQKLKDCVVCTDRKRGCRKCSRFACSTCTMQPGLCPGLCFEWYHTMEKYKN
ncbi:piggyBac transposable element-derived protein 4-like [Erpetoichthys calabaricus]|uniref:piggyBac transposable element-derived protein 4-like n=1 Tax=Erpetoichthys calabaricus TaxID=27687 RepID=UPI002234E8B3|nr:piggyBac transposable element-derived protein 4-like [Erpetoichthys calabaricus]